MTHEEKEVEIQSLNQKVEELYIEIVDLKRKSSQKMEFREQRSDYLLMSIESSIKEDKLNASPIDNLEGISPKKTRGIKLMTEEQHEQ